jgi:uncharacterized membrane protein
MIIMALDHTRDFFHADAMLYQPEDLTRTNVILFFTRWVTHICAPVFMFTAGVGAFFWLKRSERTTIQLSRFLWTRGLWLMLLEVTVLRFAMSFGLFSGPVLLTVLWALGLSMIVLGFLIWLPIRVIAVFSILVIVLQHLLDKVLPIEKFGSAEWLWHIVRQPGMFEVGGIVVIVAYTLVAWFAVMALGFSAGPLMLKEENERRRTLIYIGLGLIVAFLVIRGVNVYGDPVPWSTKVPGMTILSFLRCNKYPPSLDFLLMTLGPALLLLDWLDGMRFSRTNPLIVFGRVPLFYFILHMALAHALTIPAGLVKYGRIGFLFTPVPSIGGSAKLYPENYGYPLWLVYVMWILVVVLMYPLCLWFSRVKERRNDWWLSYL